MLAERYGVLPTDPELTEAMQSPYSRALLLLPVKTERTELNKMSLETIKQIADIVGSSIVNSIIASIPLDKKEEKNRKKYFVKSLFRKRENEISKGKVLVFPDGKKVKL